MRRRSSGFLGSLTKRQSLRHSAMRSRKAAWSLAPTPKAAAPARLGGTECPRHNFKSREYGMTERSYRRLGIR